MSTKKKIILTILLAVLVGVGVYCVVVDIQSIVNVVKYLKYTKQYFPESYNETYSREIYLTIHICLRLVCICFLFGFCIIKILSLWKLTQKIEYSYKDYLKDKKDKQEKRKEIKKEKLLKKLSKIK